MSQQGPTVHVVLDTTIFVGARYHPESRELNVLAEKCADGVVTMAVPEVVIRETVNKFREAITDATRSLDKSWKSARDLLAASWTEPPTPQLVVDIDDVCRTYAERLRDSVTSSGGTILPLPATDHSDLIERDLARRKPFDSGGSGYRDALIWHSILLLAAHAEVVFVTHNKSDFCDDKEGRVLGSELRSDLVALGLSDGRVQVCPTLQEFNQLLLAEDQTLLAQLRDRLSEDADFRARFEGALLSACEGMLLGPSWYRRWELPGIGEVNHGSLDEIGDFLRIDIDAVRPLKSPEHLLEVSADVEVVFLPLVHKSALLGDPAKTTLGSSKTVESSLDYHVVGEVRDTVSLNFMVRFNAQDDDIEEVWVDRIDGEFVGS